ncbi:MAG: Holliday junction branch migration protein RuvA [Planctomycetota bacterium]
MYDFFRGRVIAIDTSGFCSFEVAGVGYQLRVSDQTRRAIPLDGSETVLHARLNVKEDALQLFGFADVAERAAFDLLTSVSGIGPAIAMELLSHYDTDQLRRILYERDSSAIQQVKGIGKKSAERLVLELADKVERIPSGRLTTTISGKTAAASPDDITYRGLIALGFGNREAEQALADIDPDLRDPEARLRAALAVLRA